MLRTPCERKYVSKIASKIASLIETRFYAFVLLILGLAIVQVVDAQSNTPILNNQSLEASSGGSEQSYEQIEVQWGDSVSEIAERYGISQSELVRLNNLGSTRIMLGQKLLVPAIDMAAIEARAKSLIQSQLQLSGMSSIATVQQNDSLSNIAASYGLSLSEIMKLNKLSSTRVQVGQPLIVNKALLQAEDVQLLTVASGQKLSDIAATHNISIRKLMSLNGLTSARVVEGQSLILATLPDDVVSTFAASTPTSTSTSADSQQAADLFLESELETVIVQPRDTLEAIAAEFGQSVDSLRALNHLASDDIQTGDVLFVSASRRLQIEGESQYFTVRRGDSLEAIASRYNTSVNALMRANKLTGHRIFAGDKLRLPYNVNGDIIASVVVEEKTPETYLVQSGDTLYDIAYAYDLSIDKLIAANELYGSTIHPGQVLQLVETEQTPAPEPLVYSVRSGDTLSAIARRYDVTIDEISVFNNISPVGVLNIGDKLSIPEHFAKELIASSPSADQGSSATTTYVVQKGDTLIGISNRFSTSVESIAVANRIRSSYIRVGQVLDVPARGDILAATATSNVANGKIAWPLRGLITSDFGVRSLVVAGKNRRNHTGMDIDGHTGDLIYAATSGTVTFSGWQGGYGNLVVITNGNMETYYAHASQLLVQAGESVVAGQKIARVGATGLVTGSHLHFEVRIDGVAQDPALFLD